MSSNNFLDDVKSLIGELGINHRTILEFCHMNHFAVFAPTGQKFHEQLCKNISERVVTEYRNEEHFKTLVEIVPECKNRNYNVDSTFARALELIIKVTKKNRTMWDPSNSAVEEIKAAEDEIVEMDWE